METAPLKSFATWARRELITQVSARLAAVLAPASPERIENQRAVTMLEHDIASAGGGAKGKDTVADKVAYTWFNRIIALRFMDANGYTGIGIVSPTHGQLTGQPEILADAKRGSIDPAVVSNKRTLDTIVGLLDGTRPSPDAQGEAYTLLLAEYCRYWNRSMPFMFEREGDYTELLIPANLLAADSFLARATAALTEEVCRDVEVIGWLYQFYISERKDEVFAGFRKGKKAGAAEIPAATQLFTPHWIVRYLVENSVGRIWMLNHPESRLVDQMDYYIAPVDDDDDFLKIKSPEELTVIDPACGSGHMLTYAFDLLYAIYEEEGYSPSEIPELILAHNLYGTEIDPRAGALAAFALTMKARAKQRTFISRQVEPNVCVIEPITFTPDELRFLITPGGDDLAETDFWSQFTDADVLGSMIQPDRSLVSILASRLQNLDAQGDLLRSDALQRAARVIRQASYLSRRYCAVVANPPYMQSDNMDDKLRELAQAHFPEAKADLFAMFMVRNRSLAAYDGIIGMITMNSWMYLKSFEAVRRSTLFEGQLLTLVDLGTGAFPTVPGQVVAATAFVLANVARPTGRSVFVDASSANGSELKDKLLLGAIQDASAAALSVLEPAVFSAIPGALVLISVDADMLRRFSEWSQVGDKFEPRAGISTGKNSEFIRYWFEVAHSTLATPLAPDRRWKLHNKGGGGERRWYGNIDYVLRYDPTALRQMERWPGFRHDGKDRYFQPHVGWSKISTKSPAFRFYPEGMTFDSGGLGLFASDEDDLYRVLLYLNSRLARTMAAAMNPTLNLSPGQLSALPLPPLQEVSADAVRQVVGGVRILWESNEESWGFKRPTALFKSGTLRARVLESLASEENLEATTAQRIRELEADAGWGVDLEGDAAPLGLSHTNEAIVAGLVSYAVGCMFGRYSLDEPGLILADQGATLQDYLAKVPEPTFAPDGDNVLPIVDGDWFEDDIVARFRQFLRAAFGEEHFEENLRCVEESLSVKTLREYFITRAGRSKFYDDHVKRYKKRPIYWLFSSPKGSFNALIYMHRYTPSTVSTVLNEYLREFESKLEANLQHQERLPAGDGAPREKAAALKEAERLRKVLVELGEYEHDVLYPLASQQIAIDLDDGVKVNYPKFSPALKKITGLEATDE
ncbi:BREX-1 system adenine-specific DNA-methyltransferase PglX [Micrococcus endophyticus]|uniref:BREX-1 system adenine-specific DNA-methyltransferase PglX n=1 Tax=Micrococcus endophyticus TaxID=455343 RepID=UPI002005C32D|nr:BREX-1 system adenine-specific DNA-methyltransferase PglX [Micrococcus endophyticus]MCK6090917.1 BREX-1 system adenine-specific DNA-methyltransferase PglX [Micrococcus endophyticus]